MSNYATDNDVLEYEPQLKEYGIIDFEDALTKSTTDVQRLLRIHWWPRVSRSYNQRNINTEMDTSLLTSSQFTRATVFHTIAYYIAPQLTQHSSEPDKFSVMIDFYKAKFQEEFDLVLGDGVEYDFNQDGSINDSEKSTVHYNRLVR